LFMRLRSRCILILALSLLASAAAFAQNADLIITKSGPSTAAAGTDVSYDILVQNIGPNDAVGAAFDDPFQNFTGQPGNTAAMTFVSLTQNNGPMFTCTTPMAGTAGDVNCSIGTFTNGSTADFTVIVHIPPATPQGTTFTNQATVTSMTPDPNPENNTSTAATTVPIPNADVGVSKAGPLTAGPGANVSYDIQVTNAGPNDASSVSLTDTLPGTMTFVSINQNSGPTFMCTGGATTTCTIATLTTGSSADFTLVGNIPMGTANGTVFTNTANVSATTADPNPDNNSSNTGLVVATADVSILKTAPMTSNPGANVTYNITVTDNGPNDAQQVQFTDTLPGGLTLVSFTQNTGTSFTCSLPNMGTTGTITCGTSTLTNGMSATFTIVAKVPSNTASGTMITNTANVSAASFDPTPGNNSSSASTTVTAQADLTVTKSGPMSAVAGNNISYTITVTNAGPSDAASVSLTDTIPAGTTFVSVTPAAGWNCSGTSTVTCTIATLTAGSMGSFTLVVKTSAAAANGTMLSNTATVSSTTADPAPGNNSSTASTTLSTSADLSITKTGPPSANSGSNITYTITVMNNGPSNATTVAMNDPLPASTTFVSLSAPGGWNCTTPAVGANGTVNCTIATLAPSTTSTFTLVVGTPANLVATVMNTATISSATPDPTPANNSSTASTMVAVGVADLSITKTNNVVVGALPGTNVTYTITVTNNGPASAANVTVTDPAPANTTFVSQTPSQGSCMTGSCTLGTLANGASATISLVVTAGSTFGPVTNTATVSSSNVDNNPANNTATSTFVIVPTIPATGPTALMLLAMGLAIAGMLLIRRP
jgi:uncharacterized repeat protein (TIGR01451 family)